MLQKLENRQKREFGHLKVSSDFPILLDHNLFTDIIGNMFGNNMKYFDQVTFKPDVMRKKVCVDISLFDVFLTAHAQ